jgi:predicted ATPase
MDAPLYPPASAYEQPQALPQLLSTRTSSLADLQADAEALAVLKASIAWTFSGSVPTALEPLSIRDASMFGGVKPEDVDRIEAEFIKINTRRGVRQ